MEQSKDQRSHLRHHCTERNDNSGRTSTHERNHTQMQLGSWSPSSGFKRNQTLLGLAISEDGYTTLHKCYSYSSSSAQQSYTFSDGCAYKGHPRSTTLLDETEGQRDEAEHHLKDKETRRTTWRPPSRTLSHLLLQVWIGSEHPQSMRERHLGNVWLPSLWPAEGSSSGADSQPL